jgi:hypothetical protein
LLLIDLIMTSPRLSFRVATLVIASRTTLLITRVVPQALHRIKANVYGLNPKETLSDLSPGVDNTSAFQGGARTRLLNESDLNVRLRQLSPPVDKAMGGI